MNIGVEPVTRPHFLHHVAGWTVASFFCVPCSINSKISRSRQADVRGPSFTGRGNLPSLMPLNQLDLLIGSIFKTVLNLIKTS